MIKTCPRLDTEQFRNSEPREKLQKSIDDVLGKRGSQHDAGLTVDDSWNTLKNAVYSASLDSIERVAKRHQDWFDEQDRKLRCSSRICMLLIP